MSADDLPNDDLLDDALPAECSWLLEARVPEERPDDEWPPRATAESDERKTHAATKTERMGFITSPCITENRRDGNRNDSRFAVGFLPSRVSGESSVRRHRALGLNVPQAATTIGVPGYSRHEGNRLWHALTMPLRRRRGYWHRPDGSTMQRIPSAFQQKATWLAE